MPYQIKNLVGLAARGGPKIILERPKLAALIGAIAAEWGDIDNLLADIFNFVSLSRPIPIGAHSRSDLAHAIFDNLVAFPIRIEVIASVMKLRMTLEIQDEFFALAQQIRRKASERNDLIHARWHICDKYPDDLIQIENGEWIRYTENDLTDRLNRSVQMTMCVSDFSIKVAHAPKLDIQ